MPIRFSKSLIYKSSYSYDAILGVFEYINLKDSVRHQLIILKLIKCFNRNRIKL